MRDTRESSLAGKRLVVFAAVFAGALLLGGTVLGVEYLELRSEPAAITPTITTAPPRNDLRDEREAAIRAARQQTAAARRQAEDAELAVFEFLNSRFVDASQQASQPPGAKEKPAPIGPAIRPNPQWISVKSQLEHLEQQRVKLLENMTPAHPSVLALDGEIQKAHDQLAAIPADLPMPNDDSPGAVSRSTPGQALAEQQAKSDGLADGRASVKPASVEDQQKYRELLIAAGQARDAYRSAIAAEAMAWSEFQSPGKLAMDTARSLDLPRNVEKSRVADASEPQIPIGAIAILTLFSLVAGGAAAMRKQTPASTFTNADDIESTLGLPVLARFGLERNTPSEEAA